MLYGGVQKNIGPAGVVIAVIREDLITEDVLPGTPTMLRYKTHADNGSMYNTPPAYGIYICGKVFQWLLSIGGLEAIRERNVAKAKVLYDFLDASQLFHGTVVKKDRPLCHRECGAGRKICQGSGSRGLRQPERPPHRRRYARQHLQRHAHGRRCQAGAVHGTL